MHIAFTAHSVMECSGFDARVSRVLSNRITPIEALNIGLELTDPRWSQRQAQISPS